MYSGLSCVLGTETLSQARDSIYLTTLTSQQRKPEVQLGSEIMPSLVKAFLKGKGLMGRSQVGAHKTTWVETGDKETRLSQGGGQIS